MRQVQFGWVQFSVSWPVCHKMSPLVIYQTILLGSENRAFLIISNRGGGEGGRRTFFWLQFIPVINSSIFLVFKPPVPLAPYRAVPADPFVFVGEDFLVTRVRGGVCWEGGCWFA